MVSGRVKGFAGVVQAHPRGLHLLCVLQQCQAFVIFYHNLVASAANNALHALER